MFSYWLLFASLTVLGSLLYNISMKLGNADTNAFKYVLVMNVFTVASLTVAFLVAKYGFKIDVSTELNASQIGYSALGGIGIAIIDIAYFYALRYGSLVASQMFWTIGGTLAIAIFAILFFKEGITVTKALGIVMGFISLYLITRSA